MSSKRKLRLILCWHMHQPEYRNCVSGEYELPWTYLHAIKDYTDMAWHMEQAPNTRSVVNFVPSLLEQLDDYHEQFVSGNIRDPLLALLREKELDALDLPRRRQILESCFRSNHARMVEPFPAYKRLHGLLTMLGDQVELQTEYLSGQYLADLLVWYHMAWIGESVRRTDERFMGLMAKNCLFTYADRIILFELIGELIGNLIPRFLKLQEDGRIELSTTPYYHPILPLLLEFDAAREALPDATLPRAAHYPGGEARATEHLLLAVNSHRSHFGRPPQGMWPAEGGLSFKTMELMARNGISWTASGEAVLFNSLHRVMGDQMPPRNEYLYRPYRCRTEQGDLWCFFRDDQLSDKIGFEYSKWDGRDAVNDLIRSLEEIYQESAEDRDPVVSIILDGENAWEYYPYNAYYFLSQLYQALSEHPDIVTTTFAECSADLAQAEGQSVQGGIVPGKLESMVSGSWVYGNFSTWIGGPEKNRAWDLLVEAKNNFDLVMAGNRLSENERLAASRQLSICEGSDWFWWFGDYNPSHSVASFDRLYRLNLTNLYRLLKLAPPAELDHPISAGAAGGTHSGTMRRSAA